MARFRIVLFLTLACYLLTEGRISVPKVKEIEPKVIEIPPGGLPLSLVRNKRPDFGNTSYIGVTARLNNDSHNIAVVHWSGYPSERIFVLTKQTVGGLYGRTTESFLWRSTDYGRTFVNETYKFPPDAVAHWYYISKDNNKIIFRDIVHNRLYVTTDEGDNYATYQLGFQPDSIYFSYSHESDPEYVYTMNTTTRKLYVSINLGMNWTHIGSGVGTAYWTYLKDGQNRSFDDPSTIYFTTLSTNTEVYRLMKARHPYQNNTEDIQEFDTALGDIVHFAAFYEYLFAVKNDASGSSLLVSYNRQPFAKAYFPLSLERKHYAVVDAREGEVLIAVYHNENSLNLYISDETGLFYSLTLEGVIANDGVKWDAGNGVFDVHVVEGIKGTYIANIEVEDGSYGASVISFNKGAEWVPLTAPTLDNNGVPLNCFPPNCSLHLHMDSSTLFGYSDILSKETAVGLIMAQGNTGSSLHHSSYDDNKLYFSHDGGFSWQELVQYNHVFQFLDHGSIVVAVRRYAYTRVVKFSCDEGVTWNTYNIFDDDNPDEPNQLYVVGMSTELGEKVVHATVFGFEEFPFKEWLLVDLDFSLLNISLCNDSQYTTWVPTDERLGRRCLLGERLVYEKRISGECCINGPEYETPVHRSTCECAIEDFECDFNFERINIDSPCIPVRGYDPYAVPSDCDEGIYYTVSSGYRRIAGDQCTIDETAENNYFLPEKIPCPVLAPEALFIIQDTWNFGANQLIQFELVQLAGGKLNTQYTWDWGDNTRNITVTGYEANIHQSHTYSHPGIYTITVKATNDGGTASVDKTITVLDYIESVTLNGPSIAAVNIKLSYNVKVTSKFGTNYTGPITYSWNFQDGTTGTGATVSHTYHDANKYSISYSASNPVGSKPNITTVLIEEIVQDAELIVKPKISAVNETVDFSVTMKESDFYGAIWYSYDFGDSGSTSQGTVNTASHSYTTPGHYVAMVSVENLAGVVSVTKDVHIQDKISNVTIKSLAGITPLLAIVKEELVFTAIITSVAGTIYYYTPVTYHWDYGDDNTEISTEPSVTYSYPAPGLWNITVVATNNVSSACCIGRINVFKAVSHVTISGPSVVSIDSNVTFSITLLDSDEVLPSNTAYTWSVTNHITGTDNVNGTNLVQYTRVFPTAGTYEVAVLGVYSGGSFTSSITIIIRSKIGSIDIHIDPVIEINKEAILFMHLYDIHNYTYSGSLNITFALFNNRSDVSYFESAPHRISHRLLYQYPGSYTVQVIATNEVSMINKSVSVEVVSTNVSVIISFNVSTLKSANIDYGDAIWIDQFVVVVDNQITNDLQLPEWQLVTMAISIGDDEYDSNYFKIRLDILPETVQDQDFKNATDIANQLIQLVSSKDYNILLLHNFNLTISDAKIKVQKIVIVVEPTMVFVYNETTVFVHNNTVTSSSSSSSSSIKLVIELGVGGGVVLLVAIVLCVVGIAYYRRKYHRLEVQYSRLRQSDPVHFSDADDTTCGEPYLATEGDINLDPMDQKNEDDDDL